MFLPTTYQEMQLRGWEYLDIILITGDSYIDSPYIGIAVIGNILAQAGYRVGVIAQPTIDTNKDICRLGEPRLFWGVSAGSVDSMVANYTALKKKRRHDDYTPGGINNRRPDRAVIIYANLIRRWFKNTKPIIIGGIEASLRRIAHYDYWSDRVRGSILLDSKANYLLYGMAEISILEFAEAISRSLDPCTIRGLSYAVNEAERAMIPESYLELPALETVREDINAYINMYETFYRNTDPLTARGLYQKHGARYVVQNPPSRLPTQTELDAIYALDYQRAQHPYYEYFGSVKALETIQFSIPTHRGCYGECNFCAIAVHEGRTVVSRSRESIIDEARALSQHPEFKGYISDLGGPTANMYGFECKKKLHSGGCPSRRCLTPDICPVLNVNHTPQISLLRKMRNLPGIKKVFIASGIRHDMVLHDQQYGRQYMEEVVQHHVSGQLKVAPEHSDERILQLMGKPENNTLLEFVRLFNHLNQASGKEQYLTYYFIAAHPGCGDQDMRHLKRFISHNLKINPEQVQIFTPTPMTYSSVMYYTGKDPFTRQSLFVERNLRRKQRQKMILLEPTKPSYRRKNLLSSRSTSSGQKHPKRRPDK